MNDSRSNKRPARVAARHRAPNPWDNTPFFLWGSRVHEIFKESVTYQEIFEEGVLKGRAELLREDILRIGTRQFGKPPRKLRRAIAEISGLARLGALLDRILNASSWGELFAE